MARGKKWGECDGFSFTETLIVICITAVVVGLAGHQYSTWIKKYNVERETRELLAELLNARARALERNRLHFVRFTDGSYTIYEDTYDGDLSSYSPDGDKSLQITEPGDTVIVRKRTGNPVVPGFGLHRTTIYFDGRGLPSLKGNLRFDSGVSADYDCIVISTTRMLLGRWNGSACKATL